MNRIFENLKTRILLMISKALLESLDDSGGIQKLVLTAFANDRRSNVDRYQEFGFTSNPPEGAEIILLSLGGSRTHNIGIASEDRRYRLKNLIPGESAIYNQAGDYVKIKADGTIEVRASTKVDVEAPEIVATASTKVTLTTPLVEMSGNLEVAGNVTAGGGVAATGAIVGAGGVSDAAGSIASFRSAYNSHVHGGVQAGGSNTAGPNPSI